MLDLDAPAGGELRRRPRSAPRHAFGLLGRRSSSCLGERLLRRASNGTLARSAPPLCAEASSLASVSTPLRSAGYVALSSTSFSIAATPSRPSARLFAVASVARAWLRRDQRSAKSCAAGSTPSASSVPGAPLSPAAFAASSSEAARHVELALDLGRPRHGCAAWSAQPPRRRRPWCSRPRRGPACRRSSHAFSAPAPRPSRPRTACPSSSRCSSAVLTRCSIARAAWRPPCRAPQRLQRDVDLGPLGVEGVTPVGGLLRHEDAGRDQAVVELGPGATAWR